MCFECARTECTERHSTTQLDRTEPRQNVILVSLMYVGTTFGDDIDGLKILVSAWSTWCDYA